MMMSMSGLLLGQATYLCDTYQLCAIRGCWIGQTLRFAAIADASAFSIYNMPKPLRVVYQPLTTHVAFLPLVLFLFLLLSAWRIWDNSSISMAYYLARLPL
ncbi:hypothetical protein Tco_1567510, partial [Tanacetum coccineum]